MKQPEITVATALGYLRLRLPEALPSGRYPALEALSARAEAHPAFQACLPTPQEIGGPPAEAQAALLRLQGGRLRSLRQCRNVRYGTAARAAAHGIAADGRCARRRIPKTGKREPSPRQEEVLDAVLDLLAEGRDALTMSAVAQRASCSKETLYKWFGDRDGLLTATVRWQASKVRAGSYDGARLDASALQASLEAFAANWLKVISSRTSIALNRVAVSHAGSGKSNLGQIVLANGRFAIGERLKPLLEAARDARLLALRRHGDGLPHLLRAGGPRRADQAAARRQAAADGGRDRARCAAARRNSS